MMNPSTRCALLLALALFLPACGHVISKEARQATDPSLDFAGVRQDPEAFAGRSLLLGGVILGTFPDAEGSTLEILAYRLDRWGEPVALDRSGGRFLVRSDRFLDPAVFAPGMLITLTGTVTGRETRPILGTIYTYPLFSAGEIHLWEEPFRRGIYPHPNPYAPVYVRPEQPGEPKPNDPGYAPYPYTPYWYRIP